MMNCPPESQLLALIGQHEGDEVHPVSVHYTVIKLRLRRTIR